MNEREKVLCRVLVLLRTPMLLLTVPERTEVVRLVEEHQVTVTELIEFARQLARKA